MSIILYSALMGLSAGYAVYGYWRKGQVEPEYFETRRRYFPVEKERNLIEKRRASYEELQKRYKEEHQQLCQRCFDAEAEAALAEVTWYNVHRLSQRLRHCCKDIDAQGSSLGIAINPDPERHIKYLGGQALPAYFEVHGVFFSNNAQDLLAALHQRIGYKQVNLTDSQRGFYQLPPEEALRQINEIQREHRSISVNAV